MSATDSRLDDHQIRQQLPLPIAVAWHRVTLASSPEARVQRALATFEIAMRVVGGILVADYLGGEPTEAVERAVSKLTRPSLGDWMALIRETTRYSLEREHTFVPEAGRAWFTKRGKPNATLKEADKLVSLRNDVQHGRIAAGSAAWRDVAQDTVTGVRSFLGSLSWLRGYRLLRVQEQTPTRRRTSRGLVQLYVGSQTHPEPVVAEWDAALLPDTVYLVAPGGDRVLEASPFFAIQPDDKTEEDALFVFRNVHRSGEVVLAADETGSTIRIRAPGARGPVPWADWLESRATREPAQPNLDVLRTLRAPIRGADREGEMLADRFEVLGLLGTGGMATVHHVRDHLADEECALKILHPELAQDPVFRTRFTREVATVRDVNHPNVLAHVELGSLPDGELYMRMPLLSGGTVADRIAEGPIEPETARRWAEQLLSALAHLESVNVLHRDVKPSNLLLNADDDLVLSDFGIALGNEDARLTRTLQQMGSLAYMAPESRGATDAVSSKADVYSAALVLHELLAGEPPEAVPGRGLSGDLAEVVRLMGASDPSERPTATTALAMLEDPEQLPANAPLPSDDGTIVVGALATAVFAGLLFFVPAVTAIPASHFADWPSLPPTLAWLGWPLAVFVPFAAGAWVARTSHGSPLKAGALVGGIGLGVAYSVTGALVVNLLASAGVIDEVVKGALGVDAARMSLLIAEPLIGGAWATWGGLWVATLLGSALGAAGAALGATTRSRPEVETAPDDELRNPTFVSMLLANAMLVVLLQAATTTVAESMVKALQESDQVGIQVLVAGIADVAALTAATLTLIPAVALWPTIRRLWYSRVERRRARMNAGVSVVVALLVPMFAGAMLWSAKGSSSTPVVIIALIVTPVVGLVWLLASPEPPSRTPPTHPPVRFGLIASAAFALTLSSALTPVIFGMSTALITVGAISPLVDGTPEPASMRQALTVLPVLLCLAVLGVVGVAALALPLGYLNQAAAEREAGVGRLRIAGRVLLGWAPGALLLALFLLLMRTWFLDAPVAFEGPDDLPDPVVLLTDGYIEAARNDLISLDDAPDRAALIGYLHALEGGDLHIPQTPTSTPATTILQSNSLPAAREAYPEPTAYSCDLDAALALAWAGTRLEGDGVAATDDLLRWRPRMPLAHLLHLDARVRASPDRPRLEIADEVFSRAHEWAADRHPWLIAEHAWLELVEGQPLEAWLEMRELEPEGWDHPEVAPVALAVALAVDDDELRERAEARLYRDAGSKGPLSWRGASRVAVSLAHAGLPRQADAFLETFPTSPPQRDRATAMQEALRTKGTLKHSDAPAFGRAAPLP